MRHSLNAAVLIKPYMPWICLCHAIATARQEGRSDNETECSSHDAVSQGQASRSIQMLEDSGVAEGAKICRGENA